MRLQSWNSKVLVCFIKGVLGDT